MANMTTADMYKFSQAKPPLDIPPVTLAELAELRAKVKDLTTEVESLRLSLAVARDRGPSESFWWNTYGGGKRSD